MLPRDDTTTRTLGPSCLFVWLFVSKQHWWFGLVWFGFARVLCFLWVHREIKNIFKGLSHLNQLCECCVHRQMSGCINYPGFKIWQVIQVNNGFYLLNHIKVPKQMYLEFWTHSLSEVCSYINYLVHTKGKLFRFRVESDKLSRDISLG